MRALLRPRWVILLALVLAAVATFLSLGLWQLDRADQRRARNELITSRLDDQPMALAAAIDEAATTLDVPSLEFTPVRATGTFDPGAAVLVRNQTNRGEAGFHLVVPLVGESDFTLLVNVGWVPLGMTLADAKSLIEPGPVEVEGLLRPSQVRPPVGREEPEGYLEVVNRIDLDRLQFQFEAALAPFWLELTAPDDPAALPVPVEPPVVDAGPHLSYAVQWFSFAAIALIGIVFLARREVRSGNRVAAAQASKG
jgi:surfeit locus 1 family protein